MAPPTDGLAGRGNFNLEELVKKVEASEKKRQAAEDSGVHKGGFSKGGFSNLCITYICMYVCMYVFIYVM